MFNLLFTNFHNGVIYALLFVTIVLLCVIIIFLIFSAIKSIIDKKTTNTIRKHSENILSLQEELSQQKRKAYYNSSKKAIVDENGNPISISKYKDVVVLAKFIETTPPSQAIRVGIDFFIPNPKYFFNKTMHVLWKPTSGIDIWTVKDYIGDKLFLSHPVMGDLTFEETPKSYKNKKEVKVYQRVSLIGSELLVQYELRED